MIDPKKPVSRRDGTPARILCTDFVGQHHSRRIVAAVMVDKGEVLAIYAPDGSSSYGRPVDLVNVPEVTHMYYNLWTGNSRASFIYQTEDAARGAGLGKSGRIGIVHVTLEDGKPVSSEILPEVA